MAQPVFAQFMRGTVAMPDGTPPTQKAIIERLCPPAKPVQEAVADKRGEFVWRINNDSIAYRLIGIGNRMPLRCFLRARIPGFESQMVDVGDPVVLNRPELPPLRLERAGDTPQVSPAELPRAAMKSWELGRKAMADQRWPDAERYLRDVTRASPRFALGWSGLGFALQSQQKSAEARDAYQQAIASDPTSLLARVQLARLEIGGKLWTEASSTAAALIAQDKEHRYPEAHLHHGLARFMLKDPEAARASLEEAIRLDPRHEMPQAEYLLAAALTARGERSAAAEHLIRYVELAPTAPNAGFAKDQIARLRRPPTVAEPPLPVQDELLPVLAEPVLAAGGEGRVPGGRAALAAAARLPHVPEPAGFFTEYCDAVAAETWPLSEHHVPGYTASLETFLETASELANMGERRGDRRRLVLSLAGESRARTERALDLLGWRVVNREDRPGAEPGDRAVDGLRQQAARYLGIDESALQLALQKGEPYIVEVAEENVPLTGGAAWGVLLQGMPSLPGGVAQGFLRQPRLARTYAVLGRLEMPAALALARRIGLRTMVTVHADALWQYGTGWRTSGGRAAVPGGTTAEPIWTKLVGAGPEDAGRFFEALLKADRGRLAPYYAAVSAGDAAHRAWFTRDPARAQRVYNWYRDSPRQLAVSRERIFKDLPLDDGGNVRYPGERQVWTAGSDDDGIAPPERIGNQRILRVNGAVDLEALMAIARLEKDRGRPFDSQSARLLLANFQEWRGIFPYFEALRETGAAEFQALAGFAAAMRGDDAGRQAMLAAKWNSLVALLILGRKAGSIQDAEAARAFGDLCRVLAAHDTRAGGLKWLRSLTGSAADLDEGVAAWLRLNADARSGFERIREAQHVPRLGNLSDRSDEGIVARALSGVVYAAVLDPGGLLVNEDPRLVDRHVWTLFAPASFTASNAGEGSHFSGGFAGFERIARGLAPGGESVGAPVPETQKTTASPGALFRADARLVEVHTTITDDRGRHLEGLTADRFGLRDNGSVVPVASFEPANAPITCALVLDTSESMDAALPALKIAAGKLIGALRRTDTVAVYSLGGSIQRLQGFTTDKDAAIRAVRRTDPGGETVLYDALIRVNRDLSARQGKKVIVVFTDGEDTASTLSAASAIRRARAAGIPIYTVAQGHALNHAALLRELSGIARATGGLSFAIAGAEEIGGVFRQILEDLLHGYLLAFRPTEGDDPSWRRIEVRVSGGPGLVVRAREANYPR